MVPRKPTRCPRVGVAVWTKPQGIVPPMHKPRHRRRKARSTPTRPANTIPMQPRGRRRQRRKPRLRLTRPATHNTDITAQSTALNARQTAEQAQTTVETHRASTHNTDGTARTPRRRTHKLQRSRRVMRLRRRNRTLTPPKQPPVKHRLRQRRRNRTLIPTRLPILVVVEHPRPSYMTVLRHWREVLPNYPVKLFAHKPDSWKSIWRLWPVTGQTVWVT